MELSDGDGYDNDDPTVRVMFVCVLCINMQVCLAFLLFCQISFLCNGCCPSFYDYHLCLLVLLLPLITCSLFTSLFIW